MKLTSILCLAPALALLSAGYSTSQAATAAPPPPELLQATNLSEVVRHLYRWYLDEADIERVANDPEVIFWVRRVPMKLDPGDRSTYAEIAMPELDLTVVLKKADYTVEETKVEVKSRSFRIKNVEHTPLPHRAPKDFQVVRLPMKEIKDYLFRTRTQPDYPDAQLFERMRKELRTELLREQKHFGLTNALTGEQIVHLAPLSPVGNDAWVFWENQKLLVRFSSDIDLSNPAVWEHEEMRIQVYDTFHQAVVSLAEADGSNRFLTRNQIGRALYNCIVLGQRVEVTPRPAN